jgi:hypothetical protein
MPEYQAGFSAGSNVAVLQDLDQSPKRGNGPGAHPRSGLDSARNHEQPDHVEAQLRMPRQQPLELRQRRAVGLVRVVVVEPDQSRLGAAGQMEPVTATDDRRPAVG